MSRMTGLRIDPESETPQYRQIFEQMAGRILSGAFPEGYRLPPTRVLARELGTHRNTVVRAFEELVAGGFAHSNVGRGTFVNAVAAQRPPAMALPQQPPLPWSSLISATGRAEPLGRADLLPTPSAGGDLINLTRSHPSDDLLPDTLLRRCLDHVLRTKGAKALSYGPRAGVERLREQIALELARLRVPATAEDVIITTGSQQALDLIARALIDPDDTFLVDDSTYAGAIGLLAAARGRVIGVPSDDEGPALAALDAHARSGAKGLYLMPDCGNPTGSVVSAERRRALCSWSRRAQVPLIEDDYGADLTLDGEPAPPALRALDREVLYLSTFSKKLIPALRVGFLVCPPALQRLLVPLKHAMDLGTSALLQHGLAEFLERGYLQAHLSRLLPEYRTRRDALVAELHGKLPDEIEWRVPSRGVFVWLSLPDWLEPTEVYEEARRAGVLIAPGFLYSASGRNRQGIRLAFAGEPAARISEGGRRVVQTITKLASRRGRPQKKERPQRIDIV